MRTKVKICGITSPEIARHAIDTGADAIGLMFYPKSIRYLSIEQAVAINAEVAPFVAQVGVFVNPEKAFITEVIRNVHLDYLQFHGDEPPEFCRSFQMPYIKAIRVAENTDILALEKRYDDMAGVLLDCYVGDQYGGTGQAFDWNKANYGGKKPVIIAGGLHAGNVADAIKVGAPYGVDVSSGVETDGVKDKQKITEFYNSVFK